VVFLWKCVHHLWIVRNQTDALIPEELLCGGSGAGKRFATFEELQESGHSFAGFAESFRNYALGIQGKAPGRCLQCGAVWRQ
jgi:hypothetical protein